jgi:hypothetical protein
VEISIPKDFSKGRFCVEGRALEAGRPQPPAGNASVRMIVEMTLVAGVVVVVNSMLTAVIMVVYVRGSSVHVLVQMLVHMLVNVGV